MPIVPAEPDVPAAEPEKPAIAMLIWGFHPQVGGAERQCLRLSAQLAERGYRVAIFTRRLPGTLAREKMGGFEIVRTHAAQRLARWLEGQFLRRNPELSERTALGARPPLKKILLLLMTRFLPELVWTVTSGWALCLRRHSFHVLHVHEAHDIALQGILFRKLLGKPVLIKEANTGPKGTLVGMPPLLRRMATKADAYIALSAAIVRDLSGIGIPSNRIHRIPNGVVVPSEMWKPPPTAVQKVLFVGNLSQQPMKGVDMLLRAWPFVVQAVPEARLVLAGGGNQPPHRNLAESLGISSSVDFLGPRKDILELSLSASAFALPSRFEGMSNALLEAMALGMPCVATRISGSEDLIEDGRSGLLVPSEAPEALAEALIKILRDRDYAQILAKGARERISREFTLSRIAERYESLYRELATASS